MSFSIEISFFRVSFTIELGRSLLQFVTTNCLISTQGSPGCLKSLIKSPIQSSKNGLLKNSVHYLKIRRHYSLRDFCP